MSIRGRRVLCYELLSTSRDSCITGVWCLYLPVSACQRCVTFSASGRSLTVHSLHWQCQQQDIMVSSPFTLAVHLLTTGVRYMLLHGLHKCHYHPHTITIFLSLPATHPHKCHYQSHTVVLFCMLLMSHILCVTLVTSESMSFTLIGHVTSFGWEYIAYFTMFAKILTVIVC